MGPAIQDLTKNNSDVSFTSWISQNSDLELQILGYVARLDFSNFLVVTMCKNEKACVKCELAVCFQDEWYNRGKNILLKLWLNIAAALHWSLKPI